VLLFLFFQPRGYDTRSYTRIPNKTKPYEYMKARPRDREAVLSRGHQIDQTTIATSSESPETEHIPGS
jgi:hypothetical protein